LDVESGGLVLGGLEGGGEVGAGGVGEVGEVGEGGGLGVEGEGWEREEGGGALEGGADLEVEGGDVGIGMEEALGLAALVGGCDAGGAVAVLADLDEACGQEAALAA
jgi:hypothetical protein